MARDDTRIDYAAEGRRKSNLTRAAERAAGLAFAARWRAEQPFKAMLDELYGAERA